MGKKHIVIKFAAILLCVGMCLAGCNGMKKTNTSSEPTLVVPLGTDWQTEGFKLESSNSAKFAEILMDPSLMMHETGWQELPLYHSDFAYEYMDTVSAYENDTLYLWHNYYLKDGMGYCFQTYCAGTQTEEGVEVLLPQEFGGGWAKGMDVLNGQVHVLYENQTGERWVLTLRDNGKNLSYLQLEASNEVQSTEYPAYAIYTDAEGNFYVFAGTYQTEDVLLVYDTKGKLLFSQILTEEPGANESSGFHTPDGSLVLITPRKQPDTPVLKWYNLPSETPVELVEMDTTDEFSMTMTEDGTVYILEGSKLVKWNVITGEQLPLYNFLRTDMNAQDVRRVGMNEEGDVLLFTEKENNWSVYTISYKETEKEETDLVLASIAGFVPDTYLEKETKKYNRRKPNAVSFESGYGDAEAYRTRIMAELAAGKGPDLLWVTIDDMQILEEKGLLADLSQLIPRETLDKIFPGILASGTLKDTLYGIYFDALPSALFVANDVWTEETWSIFDLVDVVNNTDSIRKIYNIETQYFFSRLVCNDLNNSPFVNLKMGESHFNSKEFIEVLECFKKYGGKQEQIPDGISDYEMVKQGIFMLDYPPVHYLPSYSTFMLEYEDSVHLVHYPGEDTYPGYWGGDYFLVVNNRSEHMEEIQEYLEYLLSSGAQRNARCSIREDVIRSNVSVENYGMNYSGHYLRGDDPPTGLELKEDNTTYLEEYIDLLKQLGPLPHNDSKLKEIIVSGAQEYLDGKCTAERAAELIDNRVQLYLDEQK